MEMRERVFGQLSELVPELEQWAEPQTAETIRLQKPGMMDFTLNVLTRNGERGILLLSQCIPEQDGKSLANPNVMVQVDFEKRRAQAIYLRSGEVHHDVLEKETAEERKSLGRELTDFVERWLNNIQEQNFERETTLELTR